MYGCLMIRKRYPNASLVRIEVLGKYFTLFMLQELRSWMVPREYVNITAFWIFTFDVLYPSPEALFIVGFVPFRKAKEL